MGEDGPDTARKFKVGFCLECIENSRSLETASESDENKDRIENTHSYSITQPKLAYWHGSLNRPSPLVNR